MAEEHLSDETRARLRNLFDKGFYFETNPDVDKQTDGFDHFMSIGWRECRDPAPWFSLKAYIVEHGPLAGKNPFAHYVLTGAHEGKRARASRRNRIERVKPNVAAKTRLAAVAMVKNEADIIELFTSHLLALFDDIVIVDHQSEDGTGVFLADLAEKFSNVQILTLREPSYIQSVTMTHVIRDIPSVRSADWVFFLDADEFLPFQTCDCLRAALAKHQSCPVISMHWQNVIPTQYWGGLVDRIDEKDFFIPPELSPYCKIAFQPSRFDVDKIVVAQGNHALLANLNGLEIEAFNADFCLIHIPIRSSDQLLLKTHQGSRSYQKIGHARDASQGTHWQRMKDSVGDQYIPDTRLNAMAVGYSEDNQSMNPLGHDDLSAMGFTRGRLAFARAEIDVQVQKRDAKQKNPMDSDTRGCNDAATSKVAAATRLQTLGYGDLKGLAGSEEEYAALPEVKRPQVELKPAFADFLSASDREIKEFAHSESNEHVPLVAALASLLKPRRYVELGTQRGASFLAFAQAATDGDFKSEAIAISPWSRDDNGDQKGQKDFELFQLFASNYREMAGILRMDYVQAAYRFANRSIDLLNLSGLHDVEKLDEVLNIWRPKLSARGIIMFRNVDGQDTNIGTQKVLPSLREQYPSFEFPRNHEFGLVCVGNDVCPTLLTPINASCEGRGL